jgi:hypothetical protein
VEHEDGGGRGREDLLMIFEALTRAAPVAGSKREIEPNSVLKELNLVQNRETVVVEHYHGS